MADTDLIKAYKPRQTPTIDGGDRAYLQAELERVSVSMAAMIRVMQLLEARLVVGGL